MSAAGRSAKAETGHERLTDDAYFTPSWCVRRLIEEIEPALRDCSSSFDEGNGHWLDAGAGCGNIVRTVKDQLRDASPPAKWSVVEKNAKHRKALEKIVGKRDTHIQNFLAYKTRRAIDLVIMNPPYSMALEFIQHAMTLAPVVIALTRINFLASADRCAFMRVHTPSVYVLPNRPSFTGGKTDATEYAWLAWGLLDTPTIVILDVTSKEERKLG